VTSEGSPYARFRRALETDNERWLGRFALEARAVTIRDLRAAAAALEELPTRTAEAMEQLQRLCVARGVC
jgi:hypothetical protein